RSHRARAASAIPTSSSSGSSFSRSCTTSTPPAIAPRSRSGSPLASRPPGPVMAGQTRYRRAAASRMRRAAPVSIAVIGSKSGRPAMLPGSRCGASISRMAERPQLELVVVGGGIIGLAVAWRARARGMEVTVLERDTAGAATSHVAAGMLGPVAEVQFGESGRRLLELGLRSAELWPSFASELQGDSGVDVGLMRTGTLLLARDADEARELERQLAFRGSLGLPIQRLRPSEAREREPALAPTVRLALE